MDRVWDIIYKIPPIGYVGIGAAGALLVTQIGKLLCQKPKQQTSRNVPRNQHVPNEEGWFASYSMNPVDEFTIIPPPSPSLLSISEITETKQPAHDLLHRLFPSPISIQAIGTLFGNTSETYKIRLIAADLFEPISCGHSQTICHTFVYPIRLALQNPDYTSFFFEVVHNKLSSPISQWKSKSYASEHFSNSSNISNITHVIPLYIALQKDDVNNAYHAKNHLIHQFAPSKRCLNVIPESNELPASISKIDAPVVLVLCLVKKQD